VGERILEVVKVNAVILTPDVLRYKATREGLLKYRELDTVAMVVIWEYFNNI